MMVRPTLIDMNPVEHYPFMISLNKCTGSLISKRMCSGRNKRHKC